MYSLQQIKTGVGSPRHAVRHFVRRGSGGIEEAVPIGMNIFERDWDVLLILDACRVDLFNEFAPKHDVYDEFETVSSVRSVASTTKKWLPRTFYDGDPNLVSDTHYVTATGFAEDHITNAPLHQIDHVWRYAKSPDYALTRPEAVTDAGVDAIRNSEAGRVVLHYSQPHAPFIHCVGKYNSRAINPGDTQNVWAGLREGTFEYDEVWTDYGQNLLRVLDEVETIIDNTNGTVVVTSDHGNGLGEWGVYGHPKWALTPQVRTVPWATAAGNGLETYDVKGRDAMTTETEDPTVEEHLRALGYR